MRKILLLLLVLMMLFLGACSSPGRDGGGADGKGETGEGKTETPGIPGKSLLPGEEVLNAAGVRIVYLGLLEEDLYPGLMFAVENHGEHRVSIQTEDVLVNDSVEGFPSFLNLDPGEKKADDHRQILPEELDISALEKVTLRFVIFTAEPWEEIYRSEVVSMEQF